jgi:2-methylisocitrate lyase-like PEP mutase family enzyme
MEHTKKMREMIIDKELILAPGAYDALTAKIIEAQGFNAVYMTGYGTAAAIFGLPDIGLLTMTEMVQNASRIVDSINLPLIADADTGYGNPVNMVRTVREYEKAGVSAIHIEDQVWPKRCGHMTGKRVIEVEEMIGKIKAAVDSRRSSDLLIIARTDAIATHGFDHAIERGERYAEAGADILFIEAPENREQVERIPRLLGTRPHLINMGPRTPNLSTDEIRKMGYAMIIYPGVCLAAAITACIEEVKRIRETGYQRDFGDWIQSFVELNNFLGASYYSELEQRYRSPDGR